MNPNTEFSKQGEALAKQWLESKQWKCFDVSNIPETWKADIDIIATKENEARLIEVKYDNRISDTGNMYIELLTDKEHNKKGWIYTTASNFIMYGDANKKKFYIVNTEQMLQYLERYKSEYTTKEAREKSGNKVSVGALIRPEQYSKHYWLLETEPIFNF